MPQLKIEVTEYECSRCEWKWIARKNGKDKPKPLFCPKCKTWMWDIKRKNDMSDFHRSQIIDHAKKGMVWNQSACKWKTPSNKSEKEQLQHILEHL